MVFSSMFLASWYEVALWSAFRGSFLPSLSTLIRDATEQLPTDVVALAHQKAMARTLKTIVLPQDRLMIPMVLDTMLYRILNQKSDASAAIRLDFSPLLGLGTVQHEFRLFLRAAMEEEYVLQLQEAILSLDDVCDNPNVASQRKKGKKKKRRRKSKQINHGTTERIADEEDVVDDPSSDHHLQFVDSTPPSMERTRKLLIAMSVLEDVLDCVFARVGFTPDLTFVKEPQNTENDVIPNQRAIKTDLR
jgi:hypothetical protein